MFASTKCLNYVYILVLLSVAPAFRVRLGKLTEELATSILAHFNSTDHLTRKSHHRGNNLLQRVDEIDLDSKLVQESSAWHRGNQSPSSDRAWTRHEESPGESGGLLRKILLTFAVVGTLLASCGCFLIAFPLMYSQAHVPPSPRNSTLGDSDFKPVVGSDQVYRYLGWCPAELAQAQIKPVEECSDIVPILSPWNDNSLNSVLAEHGIIVGSWSPEAKQDLGKELRTGEARLLRTSQSVFRAVDLVMLVIEYVPEKLLLLEATKQSGELPGSPERTPSTRRFSSESVLDAARRTLRQSFPATLVESATIHEDILNIVETQETTSCNQGLQTILRKFFIRVTLEQQSDDDLKRVGVTSRRLECNGIKYEWSMARQSFAVQKHLRRTWSKSIGSLTDSSPARRPSASTNILDGGRTPIQPWTTNNVSDILEKHGVDNSANYFGIPLSELVDVLNVDSVSLGKRRGDNKLVAFADTVALYASSSMNNVVVERNNKIGSVNFDFPFAHTLPQESTLSAAHRIVHNYFGPFCKSSFTFEDTSPQRVGGLSLPRTFEIDKKMKNLNQRVFLVNARVEELECLSRLR